MKIRRKVEFYEVRYQCPKCESGELEFTGQAKLSSPPQNHHKCTNRDCKYQEYIRGGHKFPSTESVYVDEQ